MKESKILALLRSATDPSEQRKLLKDLRPVVTVAALPVLQTCVQSRDGSVCLAAMHTLQRLGGSEAARVVATALGHEDSFMVGWAAHILVEMNAREQGPAVTACARERRESLATAVRGGLALCLGVLGDPAAPEVLSEYLHDRKSSVRKDAVKALLRIGTPEAWDVLSRSVDSLPWRTAREARRALRSM